MELKNKQRLIGGVVLVGVVLLQLPFLFHTQKPAVKSEVAISIPNPPAAPKVSVSQMTAQPEVSAPTLTSASEQASNQTNLASPVVFKSTTIKPTVLAKKDDALKQPQKIQKIQNLPAQKPAVKKENTPIVAPKKIETQQQKHSATNKTVAQKPVKSDHATVINKATNATKTPDAWVMQVGAFSNPKNANALLDTLRAKGYESYLRTVQSNGNALLVVYVGPELQLEKMEKIKQAIHQSMHLDGLVKKYQL